MHRAPLQLPLVCLVFLLCQASAQEGAGAKAKDKGGAPAAKGFSWLLPTHLLFTFETYALPQEAMDAIHLDAPSPVQIHARVRQLVTEGKASLESLIALATINDQRASTESVDEVIYGDSFYGAWPGRNYALPDNYQMWPMGHRIELDNVLNKGGKSVHVNLATDFTRLAGFDYSKADRRVDGQLKPLFVFRKISAATEIPLDTPVLVGTTSRPTQTGLAVADGDGSVAVTFLTARTSGPKEGTAPPASGTGNLRMTYRFYSVPRDKARDLLATTADSNELHKLVRALPPAECKLERLIVMEARDEVQATVEETTENIYGIEFSPTALALVPPKNAPAPAPTPTPPTAEGQIPPPPPTREPNRWIYRNKDIIPGSISAFEMRPTGWRIEAMPKVQSHGLAVKLDVEPVYTEHRGKLEGHEGLARYPEQPVFAMQKIKTTVNAAVGHQCFLGTLNAPHDTGVNGRKDDGRAWLAFVMVTME